MDERRWIPVDQLKYDQPDEIGLPADGEEDIFISLFEIPKGVRGYHDDARHRFVIEFEYITHERIKSKRYGPPAVTTMVGRKTGRIRGFEINVDELEATVDELEATVDELEARIVSARLKAVQQALAGARKQADPPHPDPWSRIKLNSHVADKILQDRHAEVFKPVTP